MDQKLGPRKGFNMGLQIWHPKDGPDLTPQKMVQIWPPNEGPDLAPKRPDLAPNIEDQIWRP